MRTAPERSLCDRLFRRQGATTPNGVVSLHSNGTPDTNGTNASTCIFCHIDEQTAVASSDRCMAVYDANPLSIGHTLIVPRRHVKSVFELSGNDRKAVWTFVHHVQRELAKTHSPAAFTVGLNDGEQAGQTVDHAHVHIIPRYNGDVHDPRGGIRWVLPQRARYWDPDLCDAFDIAESVFAYAGATRLSGLVGSPRSNSRALMARAGLWLLRRGLRT